MVSSLGPLLTSQPKGCICPPTSEATCQRPDCGRKAPQFPAAMSLGVPGAQQQLKTDPQSQAEFTDVRMVPRHDHEDDGA